MDGQVGVIDQFLNVFTTYIDSGFGLLGGDVGFLSQTLIALDITLAGLFWALAGEEDVIARLIKKTLYIGFFAFLIGNFNGLAKIIFDSLSRPWPEGRRLRPVGERIFCIRAASRRLVSTPARRSSRPPAS